MRFDLVLALTATAEATAAPAAEPAAELERGLWIGPIPVCSETAERVEAAFDALTLEPVATVTLRPPIHAQLRAETERLIGQPMPIRLDGRTLAEPYVTEPITGGQIQVSPLTEAETERLREAAARPCGEPARAAAADR